MVTATAGLMLFAFLTSRVAATIITDHLGFSHCVLSWLPLLFVGVFTGRMSYDDLIVIRFSGVWVLASQELLKTSS